MLLSYKNKLILTNLTATSDGVMKVIESSHAVVGLTLWKEKKTIEMRPGKFPLEVGGTFS